MIGPNNQIGVPDGSDQDGTKPFRPVSLRPVVGVRQESRMQSRSPATTAKTSIIDLAPALPREVPRRGQLMAEARISRQNPRANQQRVEPSPARKPELKAKYLGWTLRFNSRALLRTDRVDFYRGGSRCHHRPRSKGPVLKPARPSASALAGRRTSPRSRSFTISVLCAYPRAPLTRPRPSRATLPVAADCKSGLHPFLTVRMPGTSGLKILCSNPDTSFMGPADPQP